jgi:hypothetical protein
MLEQIGMGSGAGKNNTTLGIAIYQNPIIQYMTFGEIAPIAVKVVRAAAFRQGFLPDYHGNDVINFVHSVTAFLYQLEIFLELALKVKIKHGLFFFQNSWQLIPQCFPCGGGMLPFYLDFSGCYILSFPQGGQGYGVRGIDFDLFDFHYFHF